MAAMMSSSMLPRRTQRKNAVLGVCLCAVVRHEGIPQESRDAMI